MNQPDVAGASGAGYREEWERCVVRHLATSFYPTAMSFRCKLNTETEMFWPLEEGVRSEFDPEKKLQVKHNTVHRQTAYLRARLVRDTKRAARVSKRSSSGESAFSIE